MNLEPKNIPALHSSLLLRVSLILLLPASIFLYWYFTHEREPYPAVEIARVTIPEGYNVSQIGEALEQAGMFSASDFVKLARSEEGFLFPDTYEFYKDATPESVIAKMKDNFSKKVGAEVSRDVIIMASILEEEAATVKDWQLISGILWKRLRAGMPLQVDAVPSTYESRGLPLDPISNPGLAAIDAAIRPATSPYWYYLSDQDGVIHYAETFEEHKINRVKYHRR